MKQNLSKFGVWYWWRHTLIALVLIINPLTSQSHFSIGLNSDPITSPKSLINLPENATLNSATLTEKPYSVTSETKWLEGPAISDQDLNLDKKFKQHQLASSKVESAPEKTSQSAPEPTPESELATAQGVEIGGPETPPVFPIEKPIDELLAQWSAHFGVEESLLRHIGMCESGLNPTSFSRNRLYGGMYQFSASTWSSTRNQMNHDPNPDLRFHPEEAIKTAAFKIAAGGQSAWANCLPK